MHTDNENGLNYEVTDIRRHRTRKGFQIVVDRKCLVGGATDTIYAPVASPSHFISLPLRDISAVKNLSSLVVVRSLTHRKLTKFPPSQLSSRVISS